MRQQSLLLPPLRRQSDLWKQSIWLWPTPADQSMPNAPIVPQYVFRPGKYWQPQKQWQFPTPADQSVPNAPVIPQYVFRLGGYWQPQKFWLLPAPLIPIPPVDSGISNQSPWTAYVFRIGRLWQPQKTIFTAPIAPVIVIPPPPVISSLPTGGVPYSTQGRRYSLAYMELSDPHWRPKASGISKDDLLLLYLIDELDEEEVLAMLEYVP